MTLRKGRPVSVNAKPEPNGSHGIVVETPDGEQIEIFLSEGAAISFVQILQQGFVGRQAERQITPGFPQMTVQQVDIAHGEADTGLLVDTAENARMVLVASVATFEKMKKEIDRVLAAKADRSKPKN